MNEVLVSHFWSPKMVTHPAVGFQAGGPAGRKPKPWVFFPETPGFLCVPFHSEGYLCVQRCGSTPALRPPPLFFAVPMFELRAYTLSHSVSPFL
jgi:hypothetical protein